MDPLEEAHLEYIRGNMTRAYDLVEAVLQAEPENTSARELLAEITKVQSKGIKQHEPTTESWLANFEPGSTTIIGIVIAAVLCIVVGVLMSIHPIILGIQRGFGTEIVANPDGGKTGNGHFPIHLLLAIPFMLIGLGSYLLYSVYRYLRD